MHQQGERSLWRQWRNKKVKNKRNHGEYRSIFLWIGLWQKRLEASEVEGWMGYSKLIEYWVRQMGHHLLKDQLDLNDRYLVQFAPCIIGQILLFLGYF